MNKKYKAMVLSCIDPRFQPLVFNYLRKKNFLGSYSSFTIAGSALGITALKYKKWHKTFWENLDISIRLHKIKKLIVINHFDCGVAKILNKKKEFSHSKETKIHKKSFVKLRKTFKKKYPKFKIEFILMSLDRKIKKFN